MKEKPRQLLILVVSICLLASCSKINLQGGKSGGGTGGTSSAPAQTGGQQQSSAQSPPPLDGEWEVDYEYKGNPYIGSVAFSQSGTALEGQGADQDGKEWTVDSGQVQGTTVSFGKRYGNSPPIAYTGELKYLQTPEYTGWAMEGSYTIPGQNITGKWVANPTSQAPPPEQSPPPQSQAPPPNPFFGTSPAPPPKTSSTAVPDVIGDHKPVDISGHYVVGYQYNFKKIQSHMWLENDGKKVNGRGYDIVEKKPKDKKDKGGKVKEEFVIEKGWYEYPRVTLIRLYKDKRKVTFKAQLSSNGSLIVMKGETQFGGQWDARNISVIPH